MSFTIDELAIPATLDAPGGEAFAEMVQVRNAIEAHSYGGDDLAYEPDKLLPGWLDPYEPKRLFVARVDGRIVARAIHEIQTEAATDVSWLSVEVLPEFRGRGIGSALYDEVVAVATALGRTTLQAYALAMERSGDRLDAPTGFGSVPLADPGVQFLLARGWRLEQVERSSKLTLPVADLAGRVDAAAAASGADYRVHTWVGATPQRWLEDIAMLATRMSTDAPAGSRSASRWAALPRTCGPSSASSMTRHGRPRAHGDNSSPRSSTCRAAASRASPSSACRPSRPAPSRRATRSCSPSTAVTASGCC